MFERVWIEDFICENCKTKKSYRCTHNTIELKNHGFNKKTIQLIQQTPMRLGIRLSAIGAMTRGRNLEFFLNDTFVHYQGASNYAYISDLGIDMAQFHLDKTNAFQSFINTILS